MEDGPKHKKGSKISADLKIEILKDVLVDKQPYSYVSEKFRISMASISKIVRNHQKGVQNINDLCKSADFYYDVASTSEELIKVFENEGKAIQSQAQVRKITQELLQK
jgi:transposase-like protein